MNIKASIIKLRKQIYHRFTPISIGIDPKSEQVVEPPFLESIGGLEYCGQRGELFVRISIIHVKADQFLLIAGICGDKYAHLPRRIERANFWMIDQSIKMCIVNVHRTVDLFERQRKEPESHV